MSEPIKVGDMVQIVRLMPCGHGVLGYTFTVGEIKHALPGYLCRHCWEISDEGVLAIPSHNEPRTSGIAMWRLKRIPPLTEPEDVEHKDEITA